MHWVCFGFCTAIVWDSCTLACIVLVCSCGFVSCLWSEVSLALVAIEGLLESAVRLDVSWCAHVPFPCCAAAQERMKAAMLRQQNLLLSSFGDGDDDGSAADAAVSVLKPASPPPAPPLTDPPPPLLTPSPPAVTFERRPGTWWFYLCLHHHHLRGCAGGVCFTIIHPCVTLPFCHPSHL